MSDFTESEQSLLEHIEANEVKVFELPDEYLEVFSELNADGVLDTDMHGVVFQVKRTEEKPKPTHSMKQRNTHNDRIEARKDAAASKETLREYARNQPQVRSLLENAETSWMYAEEENSVEDAIKLYRLVTSAETLAEKLMDNVNRHRNQLTDL